MALPQEANGALAMLVLATPMASAEASEEENRMPLEAPAVTLEEEVMASAVCMCSLLYFSLRNH